MQATLDAFSLKAFTRALTCLSKYGEDLSIYATEDTLSLSATNLAQSAYCRFKYQSQFFSRYRITTGTSSAHEDQGQNVTGKVLIKPFLSILKHRTVEKSVEKCELSIVEGDQGDEDEDEERDSLESKLIIRLHCKHGVLKTHRLLLQIPTSIMAPGMPDNTNESCLTIGPKTLKDLLEHFPASKSTRSDLQLVWTFGETEVGLKTIESAVDSRGRGQLSTEISISAQEFENYAVYETPTTIAFHLREFTATIAFADSMSHSLDIRFTDSTAPLYIDIDWDRAESLSVISTSQIAGVTSTSQHMSQAINKKRDREQSTSETPRKRNFVKAVQQVVPGPGHSSTSYSNPRAGSVGGSMPPPSFIPNRLSHPASSLPHDAVNTSSSSSHHQRQSLATRPTEKEPLFLPSSQMSAADVEVLRGTGLGLESMNAYELAELLEDEGEEVDFSQMAQSVSQSVVPSSQPQYDHPERIAAPIFNHEMETYDQDSFELDGALSATQTTDDANKTFQPLFED